MLLTRWERYFLVQLAKVFILFLSCFYGLYVLVDYSTHSRSFSNYHFYFIDIVVYYCYEFVVKMDVLIPFAVLIACVKTLCSLNSHNELVALMGCGIKLKRILFPFIAFGLLFTFILYLNTEFLLPKTIEYRKDFEHLRALTKQKKLKSLFIQQIALQDGSSLIYHHYDPAIEQFTDAYWVRSIDDLYRIHYLSPDTIPKGRFVERLQRNQINELIVSEVFEEKLFPEMIFNKRTLLDTTTPPSGLSITALGASLTDHIIESEKQAELLTTYYYKLALPWVCLLAVLAPAPFCTRFSRTFPIFLIYACSLFGLFSFYLIIDACALLAERQVVTPLVAIWGPFTLFFGFFGYQFLKKT